MQNLPQDTEHRVVKRGANRIASRDSSRERNRPASSGAADHAASLHDLSPGAAADVALMSRLASTIEYEIIPRLMLAHRTADDPQGSAVRAGAGAELDAGDVRRFTKQVLAGDEDAGMQAVQAYRDSGVPVEVIYLQLLAPAARRLGELWDEDLCDFTDVTLGLGRLQRVLRELSPAYGRTVAQVAGGGRRALLLPSPGEQHTFGLSMVAEFFRLAGWDVSGNACHVGSDATALVAAEWFDVVGFSLGAEVHLGALADVVRSVRQSACNRGIAVVVGGPLFGAHPEYVERVGADGMTIDGREAPLLAERLIAREIGERAVARARRPPEPRSASACR